VLDYSTGDALGNGGEAEVEVVHHVAHLVRRLHETVVLVRRRDIEAVGASVVKTREVDELHHLLTGSAGDDGGGADRSDGVDGVARRLG
jgi:hypothetical protein